MKTQHYLCPVGTGGLHTTPPTRQLLPHSVSARSGIFKVSLRSPGWLKAVDSLFWAWRELVKGLTAKLLRLPYEPRPPPNRLGILRTGTSNVHSLSFPQGHKWVPTRSVLVNSQEGY